MRIRSMLQAEILCIICMEDLIHVTKDIGDLGLCLPKESHSRTNELTSESRSTTRENIQNLISTCNPQLKENFLNCLRKHHVPFQDQSKNLNTAYEESGSSRRYPRRVSPRYLAEKQDKDGGNDGSSKKDKSDNDSDKSSKKKSKSSESKRKQHEKAVYNAVAMTALVTFIFAACIFLCCCRCCGSGRVNQTDERPLLSMSRSDYSVDSSPNNNPSRFSLKEEKHGVQPISSILVDEKKNSMKEDATRPSFDLKPPPGRVGSGIPPLKPPPGRPDPLPPEPPSVKNFDYAVNPPPPPPPPGLQIPSSVGPLPPGLPRPGGGGPPPPPPPKLGNSGPKPPPPPPPRGKAGGPRPPPPPKGGVGPPRAPPPFGQKGTRPLPNGPKVQGKVEVSSEGEGEGEADDAPKTKLKPFFWDKVQANSDQTMVWTQLKAGSFQFNEEMMETLFGYSTPSMEKKGGQKKEPSFRDAAPQFTQIIESKKAQNLSILLKALNVTLEEVRDALLEGNELPIEFLHTLIKMAPTSEEELKLRLFSGGLSQLGPADRFLKSLVEIPFAIKRMETLLYMSTLQEELTSTRDSFTTLEVACKELRSSRLFLKLLEAVLKTGNRMNDGTFRGGALAFKLDTLLKLSDVKGVDGKITLLHFVVQEIMRTEGIRAARMVKESSSFSSIKTEDLLEDFNHESEEHYREIGLQVVSHLSSDLENVKKAAALDADGLTSTTARLGYGLVKTRDFLNKELVNNLENDKGFHETVKSFVEKAEVDVTGLLEEEKKIMALVKSTGDYFHGSTGRDEGLRLFVIVRDFLIMLDKVCREIQKAPKKPIKNVKQETSNANPKGPSKPETRPPPPDIRQRLFPAVVERRVDDFSSDEDSP
ncbi:formin-like protein 5 isoform X2 [Vicia villosa]|uniref:formin-like protein 5 isoform X2 n=1 Tax=Vicia villosa TaxID=3911 RepID=UPI00273B7B1C|nr:formin-like protein 5 isoform X2 [Vicia villosa]